VALQPPAGVSEHALRCLAFNGRPLQPGLFQVQQALQARLMAVDVHDLLDGASQFILPGEPAGGFKRPGDRCGNLFDMALMQRREQRILVRKVLIQGADADACQVCDLIGRRLMAVRLENASCTFEDHVHGLQ
jgi:hypothetical protein